MVFQFTHRSTIPRGLENDFDAAHYELDDPQKNEEEIWIVQSPPVNGGGCSEQVRHELEG